MELIIQGVCQRLIHFCTVCVPAEPDTQIHTPEGAWKGTEGYWNTGAEITEVSQTTKRNFFHVRKGHDGGSVERVFPGERVLPVELNV